MSLIAEPFSSTVPPVLRGRRGAVSAAHPLAVAAGQEMLFAGGTAADAAIAAQAVLCVVMPDACGLGGGMVALVRSPRRGLIALDGTGAAPAHLEKAADEGAPSIRVPGTVDAWCELSRLEGRLPLARCLEAAVQLAEHGIRISQTLAKALVTQRPRLQRWGAGSWTLFGQRFGARVKQPQLAFLLRRIGIEGRSFFYGWPAARAIERDVQGLGGALSEADLAAHETVVSQPIETTWDSICVATPPTRLPGVSFSTAVEALAERGEFPASLTDPVAIELSQEAGSGTHSNGAGVAVADSEGRVVSSLVSVGDDFGSCVFVPELGITLNNRAAAHRLAPILLTTSEGVLGLATPGGEGQVQTLLQVLIAIQRGRIDLAAAIARPRWLREGDRLLIERNHRNVTGLQSLGHRVEVLDDGDVRFGAVVCAGQVDGDPVAVADWRRETADAVA